MLDKIKSDADSIKAIKFTLEYKTFKNIQSPFNIVSEYLIIFDNLEYTIRDFDRDDVIVSITKGYNTKWSSKEINHIINSIFERIIYKINSSIEKIQKK